MNKIRREIPSLSLRIVFRAETVLETHTTEGIGKGGDRGLILCKHTFTQRQIKAEIKIIVSKKITFTCQSTTVDSGEPRDLVNSHAGF